MCIMIIFNHGTVAMMQLKKTKVIIMSKKTSDFTTAQLKNINLNTCANYIGAFGTEKQSGIKIDRLRVCDKKILSFLSNANIGSDALDAFIESQSRHVSDDEKRALYQAHVDFFDSNPLLLISLKDKDRAWQPAVILWHEKTSAPDAEIKTKDKKGGYNRFVIINSNLDASYGAQAENPRMKISAGINTLINYQLFKSCDGFGKLINRDIIYIGDLIESGNCLSFAGGDIVNRGYYDDPDVFGRDKSASASASADNESMPDIYA